jgi:hypothetical protein
MDYSTPPSPTQPRKSAPHVCRSGDDPNLRLAVSPIIAAYAQAQCAVLPHLRSLRDKRAPWKLNRDRAHCNCGDLPAFRSRRFAGLRLTHMHWHQFNRLSAPLTQQPLAILSVPSEYLVGVYSVRQRRPRNRCARLQSLLDDPGLLPYLPLSSLPLALNDCSLQSVHLSRSCEKIGIRN